MLSILVSVDTAMLIVRAWAGLAAFDVARVAGFARIHRRVHACPVARRVSSTPDRVVWAVEEACVWYLKRAYCLQRSTVTVWLLRRSGLAATLVIGYRPVPFESHAWAEIDGHIVNDRPQYKKYFQVLEQL